MINPINGGNGYMKWSGIEIPIYIWNYSAINARMNIRLSNSQNFPVRNSGITSEMFSISGVDYYPLFLSDPNIFNTIQFEVGWLELSSFFGLRRKIDVVAMMSEYTVTINYFSNPQPSFKWTATFIGCLTDKEFEENTAIVNDYVRCQTVMCGKVITTTDSSLNSGFVKHVRTATLTSVLERPALVLSNSNNHYAETIGVYDNTIEMVIEGDFDYWNEQVNSNNGFNYGFLYEGVSGSTFINMRVLEFSNLVVNVQTTELISATVKLGASY